MEIYFSFYEAIQKFDKTFCPLLIWFTSICIWKEKLFSFMLAKKMKDQKRKKNLLNQSNVFNKWNIFYFQCKTTL